MAVSGANRVYNISVVTEDNKTQHKDYPHEIDLARYAPCSSENKSYSPPKKIS